MPHDNWGRLARFGVFIVGSEVVPEAEWWAMVPRGVSVHVARVSAPAPWAPWQPDRASVSLAADLERGAAQFAAMDVAVAVIAHSSSSVVGGAGWDEAVVSALRPHFAMTTYITTNGQDCVAALRAMGVRQPMVVFPPWFADSAVAAGEVYLKLYGFEPAICLRHVPEDRWHAIRPEDLYASFMHTQQRTDLLYQQIVDQCPADADGVLIVGTGFRCVGIIDALETDLGRPVVTANQASLWRCLSLARVDQPVKGYGRLLLGTRSVR